jgi:hypothetical protein
MRHVLAVSLLLLPPAFRAQEPAPAPEEAPAKAAPRARIDIQVHKGLNKNRTSSVSTQESYQFTVKLRNAEPARDFKGISAELYVLSVDKADESMFNLIARTAEAFDLAPRAEHEFQSGLFYVKYTTRSGSELGGYIVVVTDAEGQILAVKSSRASFEKHLDTIRSAPLSTSKRKAFRLD